MVLNSNNRLLNIAIILLFIINFLIMLNLDLIIIYLLLLFILLILLLVFLFSISVISLQNVIFLSLAYTRNTGLILIYLIIIWIMRLFILLAYTLWLWNYLTFQINNTYTILTCILKLWRSTKFNTFHFFILLNSLNWMIVRLKQFL